MANDKSSVKLDRSTVRKAWLYNLVFRAGSGYTYSMGMRTASTMGIVLDKLYPGNKEKVGQELAKYYRYYNTNIPFDGLISGLVITMEEKRAENPDSMPPEAITSIQTGLMGPVGNVGDTIVQAILIPLLLSIGISLCGTPENPNIIGPLFSFITISISVPLISYIIWMKTYYLGQGLIEKVVDGGLTQILLKGANILGCMSMGALIAKYVSVQTKLAWIDETVGASFIVQKQLFDAILPNMLSLITVFVMIWLLKKGIKAQNLMFATMIICIILSLLGILGAPPVLG